jgi:hypothetical protein
MVGSAQRQPCRVQSQSALSCALTFVARGLVSVTGNEQNEAVCQRRLVGFPWARRATRAACWHGVYSWNKIVVQHIIDAAVGSCWLCLQTPRWPRRSTGLSACVLPCDGRALLCCWRQAARAEIRTRSGCVIIAKKPGQTSSDRNRRCLHAQARQCLSQDRLP